MYKCHDRTLLAHATQVVRGKVIKKNNTSCLVQMANQDLIFCERQVFTSNWSEVCRDAEVTCEVVVNDHPKAKWRAVQASIVTSTVKPPTSSPSVQAQQPFVITPSTISSVSSSVASLAMTHAAPQQDDTEGRNRAVKLIWLLNMASKVLSQVFLKAFQAKVGKSWNSGCVCMVDADQLQKKVGKAGVTRLETQTPDTWDVTALVHLLIEGTFGTHGRLIDARPGDTFKIVTRIRAGRNKVVHEHMSGDLSEAEFRHCWDEIYTDVNMLAGEVCFCVCVCVYVCMYVLHVKFLGIWFCLLERCVFHVLCMYM
jgi:hypothetical protein